MKGQPDQPEGGLSDFAKKVADAVGVLIALWIVGLLLLIPTVKIMEWLF